MKIGVRSHLIGLVNDFQIVTNLHYVITLYESQANKGTFAAILIRERYMTWKCCTTVNVYASNTKYIPSSFCIIWDVINRRIVLPRFWLISLFILTLFIDPSFSVFSLPPYLYSLRQIQSCHIFNQLFEEDKKHYYYVFFVCTKNKMKSVLLFH